MHCVDALWMRCVDALCGCTVWMRCGYTVDALCGCAVDALIRVFKRPQQNQVLTSEKFYYFAEVSEL